jgi:DNA-directed RNA polymerase beta subunit
MSVQLCFPENNNMISNQVACEQNKNIISFFHEEGGAVLNYGQVPLITTRYNDYLTSLCGDNVTVAIMSYNGYNTKNSIIVNEASLQRGLFHTSIYTNYEMVENDFHQIDHIISVGSKVNEKTILIHGKKKENDIVSGIFGMVMQSYITTGSDGERIAKVRIVSHRIPEIGDSILCRTGLKCTIGLILKEIDMPFSYSGTCIDIIINPLTCCSVAECKGMLSGKTCGLYGGFGDCTAFHQKGNIFDIFGELLMKDGFHSKGCELLHNGSTGEQIESAIFLDLLFICV